MQIQKKNYLAVIDLRVRQGRPVGWANEGDFICAFRLTMENEKIKKYIIVS